MRVKNPMGWEGWRRGSSRVSRQLVGGQNPRRAEAVPPGLVPTPYYLHGCTVRRPRPRRDAIDEASILFYHLVKFFPASSSLLNSEQPSYRWPRPCLTPSLLERPTRHPRHQPMQPIPQLSIMHSSSIPRRH